MYIYIYNNIYISIFSARHSISISCYSCSVIIPQQIRIHTDRCIILGATYLNGDNMRAFNGECMKFNRKKTLLTLYYYFLTNFGNYEILSGRNKKNRHNK